MQAYSLRLIAILNFQISQGSAATRLRCGLNIYIDFIGNLIMIAVVKEF
jgi:hypothetical protein